MKRTRWLLISALLVACGRTVTPTLPVGREFIEVDFPPPPAQIEEFPESLAGKPECSWEDGSYAWQGRRWSWVPGRWVIPPSGCARAPGALTWAERGEAKLYYTPPYYYAKAIELASQPGICPEPTPCQTNAASAP